MFTRFNCVVNFLVSLKLRFGSAVCHRNHASNPILVLLKSSSEPNSMGTLSKIWLRKTNGHIFLFCTSLRLDLLSTSLESLPVREALIKVNSSYWHNISQRKCKHFPFALYKLNFCRTNNNVLPLLFSKNNINHWRPPSWKTTHSPPSIRIVYGKQPKWSKTKIWLYMFSDISPATS